MTKIDYSQLSDFEINKIVSDVFWPDINKSPECNNKTFPQNSSVVYMDNGYGGFSRDYCNNPVDAWPIIVEHRINIEWHEWKNGIFRPYALNNETMKSCYDTNPLRAAMIVFLEMQ